MRGVFFKYWTADRSLTALLVLLAVNLLVLSPASRFAEVVRSLSNVSLVLLLIAGILTVGRRGIFFTLFAIGLVSLTLVFREANLFFDLPWLKVTMLAFTGVSYGLILYVVAALVFAAGPVTGHRIRGAIALYLMIAAFFSVLYALVEALYPGSFSFPESRGRHEEIDDILAYFSFVTMTTVGYGDVTPVHPFARSLSNAEALVGQLYPAILIARLVTLYTGPGTPGKQRGE